MARRDMPKGTYQPQRRGDGPLTIAEHFPEPKIEDEPTVQVVAANCHYLNVRERPTCDAKIVFEVPEGTVFNVGEMADEWIHITDPGDPERDGYVMRKFTKEV